jgi:glycosyltransferase involved in cell wall biosynthesis
MKILFHHRIASRDGQAVHMDELIAAFRRLGHEVVVVGPAFVGNSDVGAQNGYVTQFKKILPNFAYELLEFIYSFYAFRRLKRAYDRHRPDVVYERYNLFMPAGVWLKRWTGVPLFLEVNAPLFDERQRYGGLSLERFAKWIENATWRGADRVLPVTQALADYVKNAGVPSERVAVMPNGINREQFLRRADTETAKARLGLNGSILLGFTGFIREWHGLDMVIDLLAEERDAQFRFVVVGDGPGRPHLEEQASRLGVADKVHFVGLVRHNAIADYIAAFDIALQPSVTPYASPLKIFEYLALGKPVVAPRLPNIEEVLVDGETAMLFVPGDQRSFAAQVRRLCNDEVLRNQIGLAGRRLLEERDLTWDGNARRLAAMFQQVLESRGAASGAYPNPEL